MNIDTGQIEQFKDSEELRKRIAELQGRMIEINENDMTEKQRKEMKVSLYDNRSTLGKKRIEFKRCTSRRKR